MTVANPTGVVGNLGGKSEENELLYLGKDKYASCLAKVDRIVLRDDLETQAR